MRIAECNARTDVDLRLHAEKAAFEGQPLQPFFNSLQSRTFNKLSPETRLFARVCYEKRLAHYVSVALIHCATSSEGRDKAREISSTHETGSLKETWKPLVDKCAKLLRALKLEATNPRLSRLSDLWSQSEYGDDLARRMKEIVQFALFHPGYVAVRANEEMLEWIELYSIPDVPMPRRATSEAAQELGMSALNRQRKIVIVNQSETFAEVDAFLHQEVRSAATIYVIVGEEDDGVRVYKRIVGEYARVGVQLRWRGKPYGRRELPKIVVGSLAYFASIHSDSSRPQMVSAVIVHTERNLEESFDTNIESECLDDYIAELFVMTATTLEHFDEIAKCTRDSGLKELLDTWPCEYQVFDAQRMSFLWKKINAAYANGNVNLKKNLNVYIQEAIVKKIMKIKVSSKLRGYVELNRVEFVKSAMASFDAVLGEDYIVCAVRSADGLKLAVRLQKKMTDSLGLQQFLELRHGCAMTSFCYPSKLLSASALLKNYHRVLAIQRKNPFVGSNYFEGFLDCQSIMRGFSIQPYTVSITTEYFLEQVSAEAMKFNNYLVVVVCPTNKLLLETVHRLKQANLGILSICETALGVDNDLNKNSTGTQIVCTTSAYFEHWQIIPQTREKLRIIVSQRQMGLFYVKLCAQDRIADFRALEAAYNLADPANVMICTLIDYEPMQVLEYGREALNSTSRYVYDAANSKMVKGDVRRNPEALINKYVDDGWKGDINDLISAKRMLHKKLQLIEMSAKVVYARLPAIQFESSSDSPMDIACDGYLEQSRTNIEKVRALRKRVDNLLSLHGFTSGTQMAIREKSLMKQISIHYNLHADEFISFLSEICSTHEPLSWVDLRRELYRRFTISNDAEEHWNKYLANIPKTFTLIAMSPERVSAATTELLSLRIFEFPEGYKQYLIQFSDRHLDGCTLYREAPGLSNDELRQLKRAIRGMEDASIERFMPITATGLFDQLSLNSSFLTTTLIESVRKECPLYLYPHRTYERLTRDLFDRGLVVCDDYDSIESMMHRYDTIQLPIIIDCTPPSSLERLLRTESALMEYGSLEWMEWMALRLSHHRFKQEVVRFYHQSVAEREYRVEDERLIRRLQVALAETNAERDFTHEEKMRIDAFVYATMDTLQRGEHLVLIEPPFRSNQALRDLTHFIRSRRMPPIIEMSKASTPVVNNNPELGSSV